MRDHGSPILSPEHTKFLSVFRGIDIPLEVRLTRSIGAPRSCRCEYHRSRL